MRQGRQIVLLVVALLVGVTCCGCGPGKQARQPKKPPRPTVTADLSGVKPFQVDEKGNRLWEASAKSLQADEAKGIGKLKDVRVVLFEQGRPEMTAQAREMTVDYNARKLLLSGNVRAESNRGKATFESESMVWDARGHRFSCEGGVRLAREGILVTGGRMTGDTQMRHVRVSDSPRMTFAGK